MTKTELVEKLIEKTSEKNAEKVLNAFIDTVKKALQNGEDITLVGFGKFEVRNRAERTAHNPQTGEQLKVPACRVPAFKPGKPFKDLLNN